MSNDKKYQTRSIVKLAGNAESLRSQYRPPRVASRG